MKSVTCKGNKLRKGLAILVSVSPDMIHMSSLLQVDNLRKSNQQQVLGCSGVLIKWTGKSLTCTPLHSSWMDFPSQSCRPLMCHCITTYPQLRAIAHTGQGHMSSMESSEVLTSSPSSRQTGNAF